MGGRNNDFWEIKKHFSPQNNKKCFILEIKTLKGPIGTGLKLKKLYRVI